MFKLERLELRGFKSFCDPTEIVFNDGVTAVVGPNGCGKSNVVDAIAWVLGAQSAKELRGGKMEDVIFNGTRDRKPVGMAEVVLTLVAVADVVPSVEEIDDIEIPEAPVVEIPVEFTQPAIAAVASPGDSPENAGAPVDASSGPTLTTPSDEFMDQALPVAAAVKRSSKSPAKRSRFKKAITAVTAGERVIIGRRLYRSGESDYMLNGRMCRLRDIQELISGTGLGGSHYAIIEQGHIDRVLSSKPYERRTLLEDAAGISIFKMKKRSAELRLESTRQNLSRLNDIITEIERQANSLKRQAGKARRYRRLREELRELLRVIFTADHERITTHLTRLATSHTSAQEQENALAETLQTAEAAHAEAVLAARTSQDYLTEWRERASALALELDRGTNRRTFQTEQIDQFSQRLRELERDERAFSERLDLLGRERERRGAELRALDEEVNASEAGLREQEAIYRRELEAVTTNESGLEKIRQRLVGEIGRTERLRLSGQQIEDAIQRVDNQLRSLQAESERAVVRRNSSDAELNALNSEITVGEARVIELQGQLAETRAQLKTFEQTAESQNRDVIKLQDGRGAAQHRLVSLQELDAHHAYYSEAVQSLFKVPDLHLLGTLADFVEVSPQNEIAVESILGDRLQAVLVPSIDDAVRGIELLNRDQAGRATFVAVGLHGGEEDGTAMAVSREGGDGNESSGATSSGHNESVSTGGSNDGSSRPGNRISTTGADSLLGLLGLSAEFRAAVVRAWPDLVNVSLSPDFDTAIRQSFAEPEQTFVTLAGEHVRAGSLVVGGSRKTQGASVLVLKREIKELTERVAALGAEIEAARILLEQTRMAAANLRDEASALDTELRAEEKNAVAQLARRRELQKEVERATQHVRVVATEIEQAQRDRTELLARGEEIKRESTLAEEQRVAVEAEVHNAQSLVGAARTKLEAQSQALSQLRAEAAARLERRRACATDVRRMEAEHTELTDRLSRNRLEAAEAGALVEQLRLGIAEIDSRSAELATQRLEIEQALAGAGQAVLQQRVQVDELDSQLRQLRAQATAARDRRNTIEVEQARLSAELDYLYESCQSELNLSLQELLNSQPMEAQSPALDAELDDEELVLGLEDGTALTTSKERLEYLRRKIDEIGPVNLLAIEELTEAQERFDFLAAQRKDIIDSISATEQALNEIKRRSRDRFRDAFAAINGNFSQLFVELFGGGRGEMTLIEDEDILEAGIDIIAQPPGKRLQNVLLLSGGEKAMTALALTLAIFRYRPSPFCVLDEVDAPLDETNTGRFCDKIIQMSEETQFLVITHTKRTMEAARALYGVTMEEPGISKLVSVRFE